MLRSQGKQLKAYSYVNGTESLLAVIPPDVQGIVVVSYHEPKMSLITRDSAVASAVLEAWYKDERRNVFDAVASEGVEIKSHGVHIDK